MIRQNLHTHSTWDDGRSSAEEMIRAAIAAGLTSVGMSAHAPMIFDNDWECPAARLPAYIAEVRALAEKYAGQIDVYMGLEWDAMAQEIDLTAFDYVIGSVHELPVDGHRSVDWGADKTAAYLAECFGGDADAAAELFFAQYEKVAANEHAQIVGHFDLITKFDEIGHFFDPESPRYRAAARRPMPLLVDAGKIFEVNTGAIGRGYRTSPYPSRELLLQLHEMGGRVTISSDAHSTDGIVCAFDRAGQLVRDCGFETIWVFDGKEFVPERL